MKLLKQFVILTLLTVPVIGCSTDGPTTVANPNDIAEYVANNPQSDSSTEPEGGDL